MTTMTRTARRTTPTPTSHPRRTNAARHCARGFALPLVILLALVATILVSAMLERQTAQRYTIARAADHYAQTHFARGVPEVVEYWLNNQGARPLRDLLGANGKAMDLELNDGSVLSVFMRDAQGRLLTDSSGLNPDDAADLAGALQHLAESVDTRQLATMTRRFGPPAVSLLTAPHEVLGAIAHQVGGAEKADSLLQALLEVRDKSRPVAQDLVQVGVTAELDDNQRRQLTRLITVDCAFYRMIMDARGPGVSPDSRPIARYGAYVLPRTAAANRTRNAPVGGVIRKSQIISWERLETP